MENNICRNKWIIIGKQCDIAAYFKSLGSESSSDMIKAARDRLSAYKSDKETTLTYHMNTPQDPPISFVWWSAIMFPQLTFELYFTEIPINISGFLHFEAGQLTYSEAAPYESGQSNPM